MTPPRLANERVALYRRVLGEVWDSLPEPLRAMHDLDGERSADGVAVVAAGSSRARDVDRPAWAVARATAHID